MSWPTRDSVEFTLAWAFSEKGPDALDALAERVEGLLREAAALLGPDHGEDALFILLLALGAPASPLRLAVQEALSFRPRGAPARITRGNFIRVVAFALWKSEVAADVQALRTRPPATARAFERALADTFLRHGRPVPVLDPTGRLELRDPEGRRLVTTPVLPIATASLLARRTTVLVSMNGQRVLRAFATLGHRQAILRDPDPRVLRFPGGLEACARAVGVSGAAGGSGEQDLAAILEAGQQFWGWYPGGPEVHGLWTYVHRHSSGGRRGEPGRPAGLWVVLSLALLPEVVYALEGDRWLQPVLPMPPTLGDHPAEWAHQAAYQTELTGRLVEHHREELVDEGGARLRDVELREAAERVGLAASRVSALMEYWSSPDLGARRFLERLPGGRWHLADNDLYRAAREFLEEAGRRTKARREARRKQQVRKGK